MAYFANLYVKKLEPNSRLALSSFDDFEKTFETKVLYMTNFSLKYYLICNLFADLKNYIIMVDMEDSTNNFIKKINKIKGNLFIIIDFDKIQEKKILPMIKALEAYSKMTNNNITTYVPYQSKNSASVLALVGRKIIFGNYATFSYEPVENNILSEILEAFPQYSTTVLKKISDTFGIPIISNLSDQSKSNFNNKSLDNIYTGGELKALKIPCVLEDNEPIQLKTKLKNIIESIEKLTS